jgi:hypothetical protein
MKDKTQNIIKGEQIRKAYNLGDLPLMDFKVIINNQNNSQKIVRADIDHVKIQRKKSYHWIGTFTGFIVDLIVVTSMLKTF